MGTLLGSSYTCSTWGKFRCVWILNDQKESGESGYEWSAYNITYLMGTDGIRAAAAGSGLIRNPRLRAESSFIQQPSIWNFYQSKIEPPDPFPRPGRNQLNFIGKATVELVTELVGEEIVLTNGSATITAPLLTTPGYLVISDGSVDKGTLNSIGKFAAF